MPIDASIIQNIGRNAPEPINPLQTLAQVYQLKNMQAQGQMAQAESAMRQQEFGLRQQQFQTEQADVERKRAMRVHMNDLMAKGLPKTENGALDVDTLEQLFVEQGYGLEFVDIKDKLLQGETHKLAWQEGQRKSKSALADAAGIRAAALKLLKTPEERLAGLLASAGDFSRDGLMPADRADALRDRLTEAPGDVDAVLDQLMLASPTLQQEERERRAALSKPMNTGGQPVIQQQPDGSFKEVWAPPAKPKTPIEVAPGGTLLDPTTFKPLYHAPFKPEKADAAGATLDTTMAPIEGLMAERALAPVRGKDQKAGWLNLLNRSHAAGPEEFKRTVKNAAIDNLNVDARNVVNARADSLRALTAFHTMLQQVPAGLVKGTAEQVAQRVGQSTDPKLAQLGVDMENALISFRRGQTGAQFSLPEDASYRAIWPSIAANQELNLARLGGLVQSMRRNEREFWERRFGPDGADYLGAGDPDVTALLSGTGRTGQTLGGPGLGPGNTTLTPTTPATTPQERTRQNPFKK